MNFPAKIITTSLDWDSLILADESLDSIQEILVWLKHEDSFLNTWRVSKIIKPGFRALFYGPPGTGKTLTACLLGKIAGRDVYRVDLSMLLSKHIAETEVILNSIFCEAKNRNLVLFLDDAGSFFRKGTKANSLNDHNSDQKIGYLLQIIEDFSGVVILATNIRANLDEAFTRRFQSMIYFPMPDASQRKILWQNAFSRKSVLEDRVDIDDIANKYELTGGSIINISNYSYIMALKRHDSTIFLKDIMEGIRREFRKSL